MKEQSKKRGAARASGYRQSLAISALMITLTSHPLNACAEPDIWHQLLSTERFADTIRASALNLCDARPDMRQHPDFSEFCHDTVYHVPDNVMEDAAMPYLTACVSEKFIRAHLAELLTPQARTLTGKLVREARTGNREPWAPEELAALDRRNASEFSKALQGCSAGMAKAAAHAMYHYR